MVVASLSVSRHSITELDADALVVATRPGAGGPSLLCDAAEFDELASVLSALGVSGSADELVRVPAPLGVAARSIALVGLGGPVDRDRIRVAAGSATRQLAGLGRVALALPIAGEQELAAALEGAALGAYAFERYRPAKSTAVSQISAIAPAVDEAAADAAIARATALAEAVHLVRDLVNTAPNELFPASFADQVLELASGLPIEVEITDEIGLAAGGFGGILGVGSGSVRPPRLVTVRYSPPDAPHRIALVGKGITFDSGGLSLKPPASMVGMKYDMTGAATVLAVTLAAARLGLRVGLTAWLCLAENLPSGSAVRPNDVLTIRGGTTVEVLNTDAEGRLVLADGLVAASEEQPDELIDVATLTGAARVALGNRVVPVMGDAALSERLVQAGASQGETLWPMPMPPEVRRLLDSDVADLANAKPGNTAAGMLLAAHFLREFVGTDERGEAIPWAHLDIAGPANNDGAAYGPNGKGPTGVTVATLLAHAERVAQSV